MFLRQAKRFLSIKYIFLWQCDFRQVLAKYIRNVRAILTLGNIEYKDRVPLKFRIVPTRTSYFCARPPRQTYMSLLRPKVLPAHTFGLRRYSESRTVLALLKKLPNTAILLEKSFWSNRNNRAIVRAPHVTLNPLSEATELPKIDCQTCIIT